MSHSAGDGYYTHHTASRKQHSPKAMIKLIHAVADAPAVDVLASVDGGTSYIPLARDVEFGTISSYLEVPAGTPIMVAVVLSSTKATVKQASLNLDANSSMLVIVHGLAGDAKFPIGILPLSATNICEDKVKPPVGHVRFVHAAAGAPAVTVRVAGASSPTVPLTAYGQGTSYLTLPATSYSLEVMAGNAVALSLPSVMVKDAGYQTIIAVGSVAPGATHPLGALVSHDNHKACMVLHW